MIKSWSPTRYAKYTDCPRRARYEYVDQMCPLCFKGKMTDGKWPDLTCTVCHKKPAQGLALERGNKIHEQLEGYVNKKAKTIPGVPAWVRKTAKKFRDWGAKTEVDIVLDQNWTPVSKFTKGAWARFKLDILAVTQVRGPNPIVAHVVDWKTGGIDKDTGLVKADAKYDDQLEVYAAGVLCSMPVERVEAALVFVDAQTEDIGSKARLSIPSSDVVKLTKKWDKKLRAMLNDQTFKPNPTYRCRYCDFSKAKGGPCEF